MPWLRYLAPALLVAVACTQLWAARATHEDPAPPKVT